MVLNFPVLIFIFPTDKADAFPALEPVSYLSIAGVVDCLDEVQPRERAYGWSCCIKQCNKQ